MKKSILEFVTYVSPYTHSTANIVLKLVKDYCILSNNGIYNILNTVACKRLVIPTEKLLKVKLALNTC